MPSVVEHALGARFAKLHPKVQWRFGMSAADGLCQVGTGVMEEMSHSLAVPLPVARLLGARRVAPSHTGLDVPFRVENYAYTDSVGRETLATVRLRAAQRGDGFDHGGRKDWTLRGGLPGVRTRLGGEDAGVGG